MSAFAVDPAFETCSLAAADWPLCQVRLQDDSRFPWLILIPRVAGAVELDDLPMPSRAALMEEMVAAGHLVHGLGQTLGRPVEKLNVAALGNVTAQLHVHVVGRRRDDALWPDPVWGRGRVTAWPADERARHLATILAFVPGDRHG